MTKPVIHLNGTSAESLLEQFQNAARALRAASAKISDAWPNGRDYYPLGPDAIREATAEFERRQRAVNEIAAEFEALWEHVWEQMDR